MPFKSDELAARIAWICEALRDADLQTVDDACNIASDIISATPTATAIDESLIDGIRWGHRAGVTCEKQGGAIIRIRTAGGQAVTHEIMPPMRDLDLARIARFIESSLSPEGAA